MDIVTSTHFGTFIYWGTKHQRAREHKQRSYTR